MKKSHWKILVWISVIFLLIDIGFYLDRVGFHQADSDETIMWLAARDMADGNFFTPAFYGQKYNTHLESILAAPAIVAGVFVPYAVKLATAFLAYLPFLLFGIKAFKKTNYSVAFLWFFYPVLLPMEWQMMACSSRGFIPGIALASVGLWALSFGSNQTRIAGYIAICLGFMANMNSAILILPILLPHWIRNRSRYKAELLSLLPGIVLAVGYWLWNYTFHQTLPPYDMHRLWELEWGVQFWMESFSNLRHYFKGLFPWFYEGGIIGIVVYLGLGVFFYRRKNYAIVWGQLALILFILTVLGTSKLTDGTGSVYFPYSRFFLGFTYVVAWTLSQAIPSNFKLKLHWLLVLIILSVSVKWVSYADRLKFNVKTNTGRVAVSRLDDICAACNQLEDLVNEDSLLIFHSKADMYNYGCPALGSEYQTIHPPYERRYWVFKQEMTVPRTELILLDWFEKLPDQLPDSMFERMPTSYPAYRVTLDSTSILSFYQQHQLALRPNDI